MNLQDFHLERADWSRDRDREALRAIRTEVFVQEQAVPESLEWDELDAPSVHVLARDGSAMRLIEPKWKTRAAAMAASSRSSGAMSMSALGLR